MKTPLLIFLMLLTLVLAQEGWAVRFAIPQGLEGQLVFENSSADPQEIYQKMPIIFNDQFDGIWESPFSVKAKGALYREINEMVQPLQFESHYEGLKIYHRGGDGKLRPLPSELASLLQLGPVQKFGPRVLSITNFSSQAQSVEIRSRGLTGRSKSLKNFQITALSQLEVPIEIEAGATLEIQGEYPIGALLKGAPPEMFIPKTQKHRKSDNSGSLFLLANDSRTQSYIVRLTDPAHVQAARDQIKYPTGLRARILVGQVSAGSNRDNQNLLGPFKHMWSWHVSKVFRFAELASQSCDGTPQFIEDILPAWVGGGFNGGSTVICFWGYQVIEEL